MDDRPGPSSAAPVAQAPALLAKAGAQFEEGVACIKVPTGRGLEGHCYKRRGRLAPNLLLAVGWPGQRRSSGTGLLQHAGWERAPLDAVSSPPAARRPTSWRRLCGSSRRCSRCGSGSSVAGRDPKGPGQGRRGPRRRPLPPAGQLQGSRLRRRGKDAVALFEAHCKAIHCQRCSRGFLLAAPRPPPACPELCLLAPHRLPPFVVWPCRSAPRTTARPRPSAPRPTTATARRCCTRRRTAWMCWGRRWGARTRTRRVGVFL